MTADPAVQAAAERIERVIDLSDDYPPGPEVLARVAVEAARPIIEAEVLAEVRARLLPAEDAAAGYGYVEPDWYSGYGKAVDRALDARAAVRTEPPSPPVPDVVQNVPGLGIEDR